MVVGLAVDYCVHLAEGYSRSTHSDRRGRLRDTLTEVGVSVLSGCITSIGGSAFMLLAVIIFFEQFGTFLFATLGFSFIYSLCLFPTMLGLIGPENKQGTFPHIMALLTCSNLEGDGADESVSKSSGMSSTSVASSVASIQKPPKVPSTAGSVASAVSVASRGSVASAASVANRDGK